MQVAADLDAQVALDWMDAHAAPGRQRAYRHAVAKEDADVLHLAPHDEVADAWARSCRPCPRPEPLVVAAWRCGIRRCGP